MTVSKDIELTIWAKDEDAANATALELSQDQYETGYTAVTDEGEIEMLISESVDDLMAPTYTTGSEIQQTVEVK